jgi:hypothetical protein
MSLYRTYKKYLKSREESDTYLKTSLEQKDSGEKLKAPFIFSIFTDEKYVNKKERE